MHSNASLERAYHQLVFAESQGPGVKALWEGQLAASQVYSLQSRLGLITSDSITAETGMLLESLHTSICLSKELFVCVQGHLLLRLKVVLLLSGAVNSSRVLHTSARQLVIYTTCLKHGRKLL